MTLLACFALGLGLNALSNIPRALWGGQSVTGYLIDTIRETLAISLVGLTVWVGYS